MESDGSRKPNNGAGPPSGSSPEAEQDGRIRLAQIPLRALLCALPEDLRGERWRGGQYPESDLYVDQADLLEQLRHGRVVVRLGDVLSDVPDGWVQATPDAEVALSLSDVVRALPAKLLRSAAKPSPDVTEAARLRAYFEPDETAAAQKPSQGTGPSDKARKADDRVPTAHATAARVPETIDVPLRALLRALPVGLRGVKWDNDNCPDASLHLAGADLLAQLREGKVIVRLGDVLGDTPSGWVVDEPETNVRLDLADVVASIPPEMLQAAPERAEDALAAAEMRDYFTPAPLEPVAPEESTEPDPGTATEAIPPHVARGAASRGKSGRGQRPRAETDWDGLTPGLEFAPRGIDISAAPLDELVGLAGVGDVRARDIVQFREENGRFSSLYDLARIPGIGPKRFRQMTGLSLRSTSSPYQALPELLRVEVDPGRTPLLRTVADGLTRAVCADGCLLTSREGIPLAAVGALEADAARHAALGSDFLFRSDRYLRRLVDVEVDCIALPTSRPRLVLMRSHEAVVVLAMKTSFLAQRRLRIAERVTREIAWLLSRRAVVFQE